MSKRARRLTRRVHPFLFFGTPHRCRKHRVVYARDLLCLPPLLHTLSQHGYEMGETILNMPPQSHCPGDPLAPVPIRLGERDTLLVVTRLPLDDNEHDKKRVLRGQTELEPPVLRCGRKRFALLHRRCARLQQELWPLLRPGFENRASIEYYQHNGAAFHWLRPGLRVRRQAPPPDGRTSAFLLHDRLWENGPSLLAAFTMEGDAAVVWSQALAYQHPEWLRDPGFLMVDLVPQAIPERPTLLRYARDWRAEVVLRVKF
jgi:hypothetical protein